MESWTPLPPPGKSIPTREEESYMKMSDFIPPNKEYHIQISFSPP